MLDWLKSDPKVLPLLAVGDRELPVTIRRLANARRMTMRLSPDGGEVRISIPRWGRTAEALEFARSRADWIARQLDALPVPASDGLGTAIPYRGVMLDIAHSEGARRKPVLADGAIGIGGPVATLTPRLRRWLEGEARALMADDLAHYCALAGKPAPRLALSNARRRWGSCATSGSIRINWRLVMAPDFVRRSVVAHEVAHLVHFDHSPRFHALLAQLFEGSVDEANLWLKREGRGLYLPFG